MMTIWGSSVAVPEEWVSEVRPHYPTTVAAALFPSERAERAPMLPTPATLVVGRSSTSVIVAECMGTWT